MNWGFPFALFITAMIAATALALTILNGYHGSSFDAVNDANGFVATINNRNLILGTSINGIISGSNGALVPTSEQEITHTKLTGMVVTQGTVTPSNTILQAIGHLAANQWMSVRGLAKQIQINEIQNTNEEKSLIGLVNGSMTVPPQPTTGSTIKATIGMVFNVSDEFTLRVRVNDVEAAELSFTQAATNLDVTCNLTMNIADAGDYLYTLISLLPSNGATINRLSGQPVWNHTIENTIEITGQFASTSDSVTTMVFEMTMF